MDVLEFRFPLGAVIAKLAGILILRLVLVGRLNYVRLGVLSVYLVLYDNKNDTLLQLIKVIEFQLGIVAATILLRLATLFVTTSSSGGWRLHLK